MSKVHKQSNDFVPQNIVSKDLDTPPVWGELAKRVEPDPAASHKNIVDTPDNLPAHIEEKADTTDVLTHYDSDFTAPQENVEENQIVSDAAEGKNISTESPQFLQEDIDALMDEHFHRGVQTGIERAESDYNLSIKTLQSTCEQLNILRETILKNSMAEMKELVLAIAEKIIRHSLAQQKETIVTTVEEAIQQAVKSDEFIISVNPEDFNVIESKSADFINSISGLENIIVRSDSNVEAGGCLIESSNCTVDATITSQLEIVSETIKEE